MAKCSRAWLVAPVLLWLVADVALTLAGQPVSFREGNYAAAVEANPLAFAVLTRGPWPFVFAATVWAVLLVVACTCLSPRSAARFAAVVAVAHAVGGATWLIPVGTWGWALAASYLLLAAEASWWCWRRSGCLAGGGSAEARGGGS